MFKLVLTLWNYTVEILSDPILTTRQPQCSHVSTTIPGYQQSVHGDGAGISKKKWAVSAISADCVNLTEVFFGVQVLVDSELCEPSQTNLES